MMLTKMRLERGWSKAKLARRAQIDQGTQSKIESGRTRPYPAELKRLAVALGVPAADAPSLLTHTSISNKDDDSE